MRTKVEPIPTSVDDLVIDRQHLDPSLLDTMQDFCAS